jgi:hypothetical protein
MADFARWGAAVAESMGYGMDTFLSALFGNVERQVEEVLESDSVAHTLRSLMKDRKAWEGSLTVLLMELTKLYGEGAKGDGWPKKAHVLSRRLKSLQATLSEIGIELNFTRDRSGSFIKIYGQNT